MNQFENIETAYDIMIKKVDGISGCICQRAMDFHPTEDLFHYNADILKSELIFWKGTCEINIPIREYIRNLEPTVGKVRGDAPTMTVPLSHLTRT